MNICLQKLSLQVTHWVVLCDCAPEKEERGVVAPPSLPASLHSFLPQRSLYVGLLLGSADAEMD